jgi:hypothetical protein
MDVPDVRDYDDRRTGDYTRSKSWINSLHEGLIVSHR